VARRSTGTLDVPVTNAAKRAVTALAPGLGFVPIPTVWLERLAQLNGDFGPSTSERRSTKGTGIGLLLLTMFLLGLSYRALAEGRGSAIFLVILVPAMAAGAAAVFYLRAHLKMAESPAPSRLA
jgi:hypothetical protein